MGNIDMTTMDEKGLRRLLRAQETTTDPPGRWCPDEVRLAGYVEHRLCAKEEARIEAHLAGCDACLAHVVFLVRRPCAPVSPVAPQVLSRARDLVADGPKGSRAPVLRWGAVAAMVVCFVLVLSRELQVPGVRPVTQAPNAGVSAPAAPPPAPATTSPAPAASAPPAMKPQPAPPPRSDVRKSVGKPLQLEVMFPSENATLLPQELEFRWQGVPATAYYEVDIVTEDGTVVWQGKVEGTHVRPPEGVSLESGKKYFFWIRAYLSGGGTVKSAALSFRIGGL